MFASQRKWSGNGKANLVLIGVLLCVSSIPAVAATNSGASVTGAGSSGGCPGQSQAIQQAEQAAYNSAKNIYQTVPQPTNLQSSTCFSNILNMGSSIGLSFFNPSSLIKQMEQMACSAAQNAVQWPVQQAENYINQNGQLPYGLGGVNVNGNNSGTVNVTNDGASSGPTINMPSTGNSTLNNILG